MTTESTGPTGTDDAPGAPGTEHVDHLDHVDPADRAERVRGCLLGGALGDALGWPVEFQRLERILDRHGAEGVRSLPRPLGALAEVTDDTQMTLFTAEGLLLAERPTP